MLPSSQSVVKRRVVSYIDSVGAGDDKQFDSMGVVDTGKETNYSTKHGSTKKKAWFAGLGLATVGTLFAIIISIVYRANKSLPNNMDGYDVIVLIWGLVLLCGRYIRDPVNNQPIIEQADFMKGFTRWFAVAGWMTVIFFLAMFGPVYFKFMYDVLHFMYDILQLFACISSPFLHLMNFIFQALEKLLHGLTFGSVATKSLGALDKVILFAEELTDKMCPVTNRP